MVEGETRLWRVGPGGGGSDVVMDASPGGGQRHMVVEGDKTC